MKRRLSLILLTAVLVMLAIVPMFAFTAAAEEASATISFTDASQRTSQSNTQQVWENDGITFTNDKASSTTNVANYTNPVRLYQNSKITIAVAEGSITKIEVLCNSASYATALNNSFTGGTVSDKVVTIIPTTEANSFVIEKLSAQVRVNSITVTYKTAGSTSGCEHVKDDGVVTVEPGKGTHGEMTYTCTVCGEEFIEEIPALGWTATFVVPEGAIAPTIDDTLTAEMPNGPAAPESFNKYEYEFAGWATAAIDGDVTEKPELYKAGETVALTADTTFYAVYTWAIGGTGEGGWELVTNAADLAAGNKIVIAATGSNYALSTTQNGNNRGQAAITKGDNNSTITFGDDVQVITLENGNVAGTLAFNVGSGYLYAAGSGKNYLRTEEILSNNSSWLITIDGSGVATIKAQGNNTNNWLRYNSSSSIFACYASGQKDVSIYKESVSGTRFYTTVLEAEDASCTHENYTIETVEATCSTPGSVTATCNDCGLILDELCETIEALGHDYVSEETKAPSCTETGEMTYTCQNDATHTYTEDIEMLPHNYVDNVCVDCGKVDYNYSGHYYIATIRKEGNYFYMTSDLGTASTKRYQAVDTGLTTLPAEITAPETGYVFVFEKNDDGTYSIYAEGVEGNNYLGWTSGSSGALVAKESALKLTVDLNDDGTYLIHFTASDGERYLSLNATAGNDYFAWYKTGQKKDLTLIPVNEAEEEETSKITSASITIGTNLSLNYYVKLADGENIADYAMRFTMNGVATTVTEYVYNETLGQYVFTFTGIAPQCMGDNITAELMKADEVVYTKDNYSVRQNAINLMNEEGATDALKTLLVDMLNYGAKAQLYKNYKTDALANAGYEETASDATPSEVDNVKEVSASKNAAYNIKALGVRFDYDNKLYVRFIAESTEGLVVKIGGTEATIEADGNGNYIAYSEGIGALGFATTYTFELILGGETIQTAEYSVNSYAYSMREHATMSELALALYNYGKSAMAYNAENN